VNILLTLDVFCWGASPLVDGATIGPLLVPAQGFNQQICHEFASPNSFRSISQSDCTPCTYTWLQRWRPGRILFSRFCTPIVNKLACIG
jgi:hypothetical protein